MVDFNVLNAAYQSVLAGSVAARGSCTCTCTTNCACGVCECVCSCDCDCGNSATLDARDAIAVSDSAGTTPESSEYASDASVIDAVAG